MPLETLTFWMPILGVAGMIFASLIYVNIVRRPAGNPRMLEIAEAIHSGAMAYLKRQYTILVIFVVVVAALLGVFLDPVTASPSWGAPPARCSPATAACRPPPRRTSAPPRRPAPAGRTTPCWSHSRVEP
ncbi:MAG TPA: sodium/proton-translocating pyrophosphatase, partial [Candidatus Polarisedimenticolia bacterium]|nr:sodium/proton-translocating pyrophosphatase [Candidatus Polarisedimenticolia bacterium]